MKLCAHPLCSSRPLKHSIYTRAARPCDASHPHCAGPRLLLERRMKIVVTVLLVVLIPALATAQAQKSDYQAGYIAGAQAAANAAVKFVSAAPPTPQPAVIERRPRL